MKQVFNPYLPLSTYIPDGEPHVFDDRLYIFGSHDKEGGDGFCLLDYEVWSAPVNDLTDWTCHGISYKAQQDPLRDEDHLYMYAPDVVRGNDGKYYLFYALAGKKFTSTIHVAVSDLPEGPYQFHGELKTVDGQPFERNITFDPAVINDDGIIRMYYGWALAAAPLKNISGIKRALMKPMISIVERKLFDKTSYQIRKEKNGLEGAFNVTIADDMLTVISEPKKIAPGQFDATDTDFSGHAFFEASSIRKINGIYYFIYSSEVNHELCYAISRFPDKDFHYGGVIISNGDIGFNGRKETERLTATGNNHGSIELVNGKWYIFYHRQTHRSSFSRQGCAEKIELLEDGSIPQVEMTSCGLNNGSLLAEGDYPAAIACNLTNGHMPHIIQQMKDLDFPAVTNRGEDRFITGINNGVMIGYKYFSFDGKTKLSIVYQSTGEGRFRVLLNGEEKGFIMTESTEGWQKSSVLLNQHGSCRLELIYEGEGEVELLNLSFQKEI